MSDPTQPQHRSVFAPLRSRSFAFVWTGSVVSNIGTWMQAAALGFYVAHLTKSATWTAVVAIGEFAPTALLGPIGGAIADRYSRRAIAMFTTLEQTIAASIITFLMVVGKPGAPVIAIYALSNGCMFALGFPSLQSMTPEFVPKEDLSGAIGLSSAAWNLGRVLGPVIGALIYKQWGITWVLGINAASFLAVLFALSMIRLAKRPPNNVPIFAAIAEGLRFIRNEPGLNITIRALTLNTLCIAPFIGLIPAMVEKVYRGHQGDVSRLITAQGIGAVITGFMFARLTRRYSLRQVFTAALWLGPIAIIAYGLAPNSWYALVPLICTGAIYFAVMTSVNNIAQLRAPTEFRGRVLSTNQVVLGSVYSVALAIQGRLGDVFGVREVTIGSGVALLAALTILSVTHPDALDAIEQPVDPGPLPTNPPVQVH